MLSQHSETTCCLATTACSDLREFGRSQFSEEDRVHRLEYASLEWCAAGLRCGCTWWWWWRWVRYFTCCFVLCLRVLKCVWCHAPTAMHCEAHGFRTHSSFSESHTFTGCSRKNTPKCIAPTNKPTQLTFRPMHFSRQATLAFSTSGRLTLCLFVGPQAPVVESQF